MSAQNALNTAIYSLLSGDATLVSLLGGTNIYYGRAPEQLNTQGTALHWVIQAGGDENSDPTRSKNFVINLRASVSGNNASHKYAGSIIARADSLLNGQTLTVSGWTNIWTAAEDEFSPDAEIDESGVPHYTSGQFYRIRLTK